MKRTKIVTALAAAVMLGMTGAAMASAPAGLAGAAQALQPEQADSAVQAIKYRYRCWWNGRREVCGWTFVRPHYGAHWRAPRHGLYHYNYYPRYYGYGWNWRRHWR